MPRPWGRIRRTPSRPRERRELTEEERAIRATRVSPYQARIERRLTDIFFEVPAERQAGREWRLTHVAHTRGHAVCELCGHNPIRRLFFINSVSTGQELMIGSECARNYVGVDLVDAYIRNIGREQAHRRQSREQQERTERIQREAEERRTRIDQERRSWRQHHGAIGQFLREPGLWADSNDRFLRSLAEWLDSHGYLTVNQTRAVRRNLRERPNIVDDNHQVHDRIEELVRLDLSEEQAEAGDVTIETNDVDPSVITAGTILSGRLVMDQNGITRVEEATTVPATSTEQPVQMFNGVYEVTITGSRTKFFSIYTVQTGTLQGRRIVKYALDPTELKGFAFLTSDGTLALWRRFQNREEHPWIGEAEHLLHLLRTREPYREFAVAVPESGGLIYRVRPNLTCLRCNGRLPIPRNNYDHNFRANMCRSCIDLQGNNRPHTLADLGLNEDHPVTAVQADAIGVLRRTVNVPTPMRRVGATPAPAHPTAPPVEPRTSELGTGWLQ